MFVHCLYMDFNWIKNESEAQPRLDSVIKSVFKRGERPHIVRVLLKGYWIVGSEVMIPEAVHLYVRLIAVYAQPVTSV